MYGNSLINVLKYKKDCWKSSKMLGYNRYCKKNK